LNNQRTVCLRYKNQDQSWQEKVNFPLVDNWGLVVDSTGSFHLVFESELSDCAFCTAKFCPSSLSFNPPSNLYLGEDVKGFFKFLEPIPGLKAHGIWVNKKDELKLGEFNFEK
jgi:hypothetical protein